MYGKRTRAAVQQGYRKRKWGSVMAKKQQKVRREKQQDTGGRRQLFIRVVAVVVAALMALSALVIGVGAMGT